MSETAGTGYWADRQDMLYYRCVFQLASVVAADAGSLIDVGSRSCGYLDWFHWVGSKTSLDIDNPYTAPGVVPVRADFLEWKPDRSYDLVLCLQVLEHLSDEDVKAFAGKLLELGSQIIVSVPYMWPAGGESGHLQDPVTPEKLDSWMGRKPNAFYIVEEPLGEPGFNRRLVAHYNHDDPARKITGADLCRRRVPPACWSAGIDPGDGATVSDRSIELLLSENRMYRRNMEIALERSREFEKRYNDIRGSFCWRATRPLRRALDLVKMPFRR